MSFASSPMPRAVCDWCRPWLWRPTRTGWKAPAISTWTIWPSTRSRRCGARHDQGPNLPKRGAVLAAVKTAARRLRRWPTASLDRGCARRHPDRRSGRRNGAFGRTKKLHSIPDVFAELPAHNSALCSWLIAAGEKYLVRAVGEPGAAGQQEIHAEDEVG